MQVMARHSLRRCLGVAAFVLASLGALTLAAQAVSAAHYGAGGVHFYWVVYLYWLGAVPAIGVLGCVIARAA